MISFSNLYQFKFHSSLKSVNETCIFLICYGVQVFEKIPEFIYPSSTKLGRSSSVPHRFLPTSSTLLSRLDFSSSRSSRFSKLDPRRLNDVLLLVECLPLRICFVRLEELTELSSANYTKLPFFESHSAFSSSILLRSGISLALLVKLIWIALVMSCSSLFRRRWIGLNTFVRRARMVS